jgi:hypothetical protein
MTHLHHCIINRLRNYKIQFTVILRTLLNKLYLQPNLWVYQFFSHIDLYLLDIFKDMAFLTEFKEIKKYCLI